MARIAGVDLPRTKRVEIGLTYIYGIGRVRSNDILEAAGVSGDIPDGALHDDECRLEPGDTLLLYTDGVTEAMNARREVFGIDRLTRTLERAAGESVDEIRDRILAEVRGFMSDQRDDLTLVVLRYR